MGENKRALGALYEQVAAEYLTSNGMDVIERNFSCQGGEIDIIAKDAAYIVFCEVKYRKDIKFGYPEEAVGRTKIMRIKKAASYYIYTHHISEGTPVRFDVVSILGDKIKHIKDAF